MTDSLPPESSPGLLLWRVSLSWQRRMMTVLKPLGLTHVQFVLLTSIWWLTHKAGEQPSQRRVAEFAGTDVMMTSQVVRTLEGKGLIERHSDPDDARSKIVALTPTGRDLILRAVHDVETADQDFFEHVDQHQLLNVLHLLERP